MTWPASLQILTFGDRFNQNLRKVTWPAGLQNLTFGQDFDQSLDDVAWPAGLQSLIFKTFPAQKLNVVWPGKAFRVCPSSRLSFGERTQMTLTQVSTQKLCAGHGCLEWQGWPRALR